MVYHDETAHLPIRMTERLPRKKHNQLMMIKAKNLLIVVNNYAHSIFITGVGFLFTQKYSFFYSLFYFIDVEWSKIAILRRGSLIHTTILQMNTNERK